MIEDNELFFSFFFQSGYFRKLLLARLGLSFEVHPHTTMFHLAWLLSFGAPVHLLISFNNSQSNECSFGIFKNFGTNFAAALTFPKIILIANVIKFAMLDNIADFIYPGQIRIFIYQYSLINKFNLKILIRVQLHN